MQGRGALTKMLDILKRAAEHAEKQPMLVNLVLRPEGVIVTGRFYSRHVTWEQIELTKGDGVLLYAIDAVVSRLKRSINDRQC